MGMESGQFDDKTFQNALDELKKKIRDPNFGGVFDWEYLNAPPVQSDPSQWSRLMNKYIKYTQIHKIYIIFYTIFIYF